MSKFANMTDEELEAQGNHLVNEELTPEEEKEFTPSEPSSAEETGSFEVQITEVEPEKGEDTPDAHRDLAPVSDTSTPVVEPPVATPQPIDDNLYNELIKENPTLAKFSKEDFLRQVAKAYVNAESKIGEREKPPIPQPPSDTKRLAELNERIKSEAERRMLNDPTIQSNLIIKDREGNITTYLKLPADEKEFEAMKRDYPAESVLILTRMQQIYGEVQHDETERTNLEAQQDTRNEKASTDFVVGIQDYFKKIAPNISKDEWKKIGEATQTFIKDAYNPTLINRYVRYERGIPFLDKDLLLGDFIAKNTGLTTELASISAKNGTGDTAQKAIQQVQKGVSMKTLSNQKISSKTPKKVNLLSPKDLGRLSTEELLALEDPLVNK